MIRPVSALALSLTRSFQVPLATTDEALTVYVVTTLSLLPPEPYAFRLKTVPFGATRSIFRSPM